MIYYFQREEDEVLFSSTAKPKKMDGLRELTKEEYLRIEEELINKQS